MMGLKAEDLLDVRRWAICGAVVVGAHAGLPRPWSNGTTAPICRCRPPRSWWISRPSPRRPTQVENELPPGPSR